MTKDEALKKAIDIAESWIRDQLEGTGMFNDAIKELAPLKEALAQPDDTAKLYEELRSIIDGGSESFTHEDAVQYLKDKLAQRTWVGLMRGVRVEGDTVVISTNNNDAARELCGSLVEEMNT